MLFRMKRGTNEHFHAFRVHSAGDLGLKEKDIENWVAQHPELLFGQERVLVFAQSVMGDSMADIIALDTAARLVLVELKRDWSDRATVGQLLEYAATISGKGYGYLNDLARRYGNGDSKTLIEQFREFVDDDAFNPEDLAKVQRVCIVAPAADMGLRSIVDWLKRGGIKIDFVPFTLYADTDRNEVFVEIEPLTPHIDAPTERKWEGDWFFNTNETHATGAYKQMFKQGVIAIYGYETGPDNLTGSEGGQRVFAYVNQKGIMAVGRIQDGTVLPGTTIFDGNKEFHVKVNWEAIVAEGKGVTLQETKAQGYGLPIRSTFCGMYNANVANWIDQELRSRSKTP
jgi:hypothetical protein